MILGLERSPVEGNGNPFQNSGLENSMDRGAGHATVHGVTKSWAHLSNCHFHFFSLPALSFLFLPSTYLRPLSDMLQRSGAILYDIKVFYKF